MWHLFLTILSLASVSFGGAQILLAGLERELVQSGRIGRQAFAAAVALGQSTPGPLAAFTTAVGMDLGGLLGAITATSAVVVASLVMVGLIQLVPAHVLRHRLIRSALAGVAPLGAPLVTFLAVRMLSDNWPPTLLGPTVAAGVLLGKRLRVPTICLMGGAVLLFLFLG